MFFLRNFSYREKSHVKPSSLKILVMAYNLEDKDHQDYQRSDASKPQLTLHPSAHTTVLVGLLFPMQRTNAKTFSKGLFINSELLFDWGRPDIRK